MGLLKNAMFLTAPILGCFCPRCDYLGAKRQLSATETFLNAPFFAMQIQQIPAFVAHVAAFFMSAATHILSFFLSVRFLYIYRSGGELNNLKKCKKAA